MNEVVFKTDWFFVEEVRRDDLPFLKGKPFYRITPSDGVVILATDEQGKLILVRQFRPALDAETLEVPCGALESNEDPEPAARRELLEETGYEAGEMILLGTGRSMMNRNTAIEYLYYAPNARFMGRRTGDPGEIAETVLLTSDELREKTLSGEFEQFSALATLRILEWKLGVRL